MEEVFAAGPQIGEPVVGVEIDIVDGAEHRFTIFPKYSHKHLF